ncbi:unnamed protein product [Amaranthus hypochondriacus]
MAEAEAEAQAETMSIGTNTFNTENNIYSGTLPMTQSIVDASVEDVLGKMSCTQKDYVPVPVEGTGIDPPDAAIEFDSPTSGEQSYSLWVNIQEDDQHKCYPHESISKFESVLLPLEEGIYPEKIFLGESQQRQELPQHEVYAVPTVSGSMQSGSNLDITGENDVLQRLLRRWRYFDDKDGSSCIEDPPVNISTQKFGKPCYVCGQYKHNGKKCPKRRICSSCKIRGHIAVDCPTKDKENIICLRCGESGHELFSCSAEYSTDDLKNVRCYVCNELGHLCCDNYAEISSPSCYNCGESGHAGLQCPKPHLDKCGSQPPPICYKCGDGDHVARNCTKDTGITGCDGRQQASDLDLGAEIDETRRTARRSKTYRYGRMKKRKMKAIIKFMTV